MINIISRILTFLLVAFTAVLPMKADGVEITVRDVTTESAAISFVCVNKTNRRIDRPDIEKIEKNIDGKWEKIDIGLGCTEEFYYIYPNQDSTEHFDFGTLDENGFVQQYLDEGEYKLTISYKILNPFKGEKQQGYSSTVFTVTKAG